MGEAVRGAGLRAVRQIEVSDWAAAAPFVAELRVLPRAEAKEAEEVGGHSGWCVLKPTKSAGTDGVYIAKVQQQPTNQPTRFQIDRPTPPPPPPDPWQRTRIPWRRGGGRSALAVGPRTRVTEATHAAGALTNTHPRWRAATGAPSPAPAPVARHCHRDRTSRRRR